MQNHLKKLLPFSFPDRDKLPLVLLYRKFHEILERNSRIIELMEDMEDKLGGEYVFDNHYIEEIVSRLGNQLFLLISDLAMLTRQKDGELQRAYWRIRAAIEAELTGESDPQGKELVLPLSSIGPSTEELVGDKMAILGYLKNRLLLPTADGFVITVPACILFMQRHGLLKKAETGVSLWQAGDEPSFRSFALELQDDICRAALPRKLSNRIFAQFDDLARQSGKTDLRVALRSSGWGEGREHSFAGQYTTLLNIAREELLEGYRRVIASLYDPGVWRYRLQKGYREHEIAMAVGCQVMVDSEVSGVMHTFAPHIDKDSMVINATWGLCELVMQGEQSTDVIVVDRRPPHEVLSSTPANKFHRLIPSQGGGTTLAENPSELQGVLSLTPGGILQLAQMAMNIERYYKRPQEIEWSYDARGDLQILQARPLYFRGNRLAQVQQVHEAVREAEIIFANQGYTVQCGIGMGRIVRVENDKDLETFPDGAILLSRHASPRYGSVMHKARGIITDAGSPTGHMATLARECRVPTLVSTKMATNLLRDGDEVTLDATHGVVYRGYLYPLDRFELSDEEPFEDSYEYRLLRRLTHHVGRLHLVHTHDEPPSPAACRTYRDVAHYIHIKAVDELIARTEKTKSGKGVPARRLETDIPLGLYIIDVGGGTSCTEEERTLTVDQLHSRPLKEMLDGISVLGMWCTEPVAVDLGSFMSSFTRTFCTSMAGPSDIGRNLAVVTGTYANINLRLGYHFTLINASLSGSADDDYLSFRFWGGVTEPVRRSRRASFIARVLRKFDFLVTIHGDMVSARLKKRPFSQMVMCMQMLGGLIGYTRQLDACLYAESDVDAHVELFIKAIHGIIGGYNG